jgi:hypothetical protein
MLIHINAETLTSSCQDLLFQKEVKQSANKEKWEAEKDLKTVEVASEVVVVETVAASEEDLEEQVVVDSAVADSEEAVVETVVASEEAEEDIEIH